MRRSDRHVAKPIGISVEMAALSIRDEAGRDDRTSWSGQYTGRGQLKAAETALF